MKKWILEHKTLYYLIVGIFAFFLFMAITLHGVKKASASTQSVVANIDGEMMEFTVPDIRDVDWNYWLSLDASNYYSEPQSLASKIISECSYMIVRGTEPTYLTYFFYKNPFYYDGPLNIQANIHVDYDNGYAVTVVWRDGIPRVESVSGLFDNISNTDDFWLVMYNGGSFMVGSTYDYLVNCTDTRKDNITRNNLIYPSSNLFSMDYPYFRFKELDIRNKLYNGEVGLGLDLDEIYTKLSAQSTWTYNGYIENFQGYENCDMYLDLNVTLSLPSVEWLNQQFTSITTSGTTYAKWSQDIIDDWYLLSDIPKDNYNFDMPMPIVPASDGQFSFSLTYNELMAYIKYNYEDFRHTVNDMPLCTQGLYASLIHVSDMRGSVVTEDNGNNLYGRFTHNEFVKGDEKTCLEVIPNENYYDMPEDEFDEYFDSIYKDAHSDYVGQLQNKVDDLQNQIDNMQTIEGAFGNLGASDLWTGFTGTVKGVSQLGASVGTLSAMVGSVLAFLPMQIGSYMAFTLFAILVIAIIKAIRG